jgi:2',3'-cyclic-nucleotide 2'-phosphodiesterase (5'-nucleotidase family)
MPHSESIAYSEKPEKPFMSLHGLEPYEIKEVDGEFVACLPIIGSQNAKEENFAEVFGEINFSSEEEAFRAVAEARKDLVGLDLLN